MENAKRIVWTKAWRWLPISAGPIALFWTIYWLITGSIPVVMEITQLPSLTITLPLGISRWWDVLIGPIWSIMIFLSIRIKRKKHEHEDLLISPIIGLSLGLLVVLVGSLGNDNLSHTLSLGLINSLILGFGVGTAIGIGEKTLDKVLGLSVTPIVINLGISLGAALKFGLIFGLIVVLTFGLVTALVMAYCFVLVVSMKTLSKNNRWQ